MILLNFFFIDTYSVNCKNCWYAAHTSSNNGFSTFWSKYFASRHITYEYHIEQSITVLKRQIETINQYVETPGQSRIVEVYYCIICNCLESKQYFYFIFHNTCIEELGNKNKLTVNSGSNYKSLQLQDSFLEFNKFKHLQQKLTKFSGVSGYLVFRKTATYKKFTKSSGKDCFC